MANLQDSFVTNFWEQIQKSQTSLTALNNITDCEKGTIPSIAFIKTQNLSVL